MSCPLDTGLGIINCGTLIPKPSGNFSRHGGHELNVRRVWRLPRTTGCSLPPGVCNDRGPEEQLLNRSIRFLWSALTSQNQVLRLCARLAHEGSGSALSNTISYVSFKYGVQREIVGRSFRCIPYPVMEPLGPLVRDLIMSLHGYLGEDRDELISILHSVWCNLAGCRGDL